MFGKQNYQQNIFRKKLSAICFRKIFTSNTSLEKKITSNIVLEKNTTNTVFGKKKKLTSNIFLEKKNCCTFLKKKFPAILF